ncbi:MAG: hypothetical protein WCH34_01165 [Bacteroidota bacterium]
MEEYLFNRLNFFADIYFESATAYSLSSAEPSFLSSNSFSYNTLNDSNVYLNQVVSTCSFLMECSYQATYFSDKSNDNIIDVCIQFSDVKESFNDVKESFSDVKESFSDVNESFSDVKESFSDVKESFSDVKESFSDAKESFSDVKKSFNDAKESFNDVKESFNDVDFRPDKALSGPNHAYITNIYTIIYMAYLTQYLCLFYCCSINEITDIYNFNSITYKNLILEIYITETL